MNKIEFFQKMHELLKTKKQVFGKLLKIDGDKECYCVEGLILLALGANVCYSDSQNCYFLHLYNLDICDEKLIVYFDESIPVEFFDKYIIEYLPPEISVNVIYNCDTINLNCVDKAKKFYSWYQINDTLKLNFSQIEEILKHFENE
jgi:hypothetical protein